MAHDLTYDMISIMAEDLNIEPNLLDALCRIEARGPGFLPSSKPVIRFEGHIFWKDLQSRGFAIDKLNNLSQTYPNVLYPKPNPAFYLGGEREYQRLDDALKIQQDSAFIATAWGCFHVLGLHYSECGFNNVFDFVEEQKIGLFQQLETFCKWLKSRRLPELLQQKDWALFCRLCYGPKYEEKQYDKKLQRSYEISCQLHKNR